MSMDRKKMIVAAFLVVCSCSGWAGGNKIDRKALVTRHNVTMTEIDKSSPLSVGNGRFCYTADITGMQTFPELYKDGLPLSTMSEWGWHSFPNPENHKLSDVFTYLDAYGKQVPYPIGNSSGREYLRANPHQTGLALIGLQKVEGGNLSVSEVADASQSLNLWEGTLNSRFKLSGSPVSLTTCCHPDADRLAFNLTSALFSSNQLGVQIRFPYPSATFGKDPAVFGKEALHQSEIIEEGKTYWIIKHQIDDFVYYCQIQTSGNATLKETAKHDYLLVPATGKDAFTLLVDFSMDKTIPDMADDYASTMKANQQAWQNYWMSGGAVDLSGSKDKRWKELERRIVLSQYLTAIQSRQQYPPQETGLTCNSWYGKFHLEMHWWHSVHFALWDRTAYLTHTLKWYDDISEEAKKYTVTQGYKGIRWPKMIGPDGKEAPSSVGPLLVWQEPHPIFYSELLYRDNPTPETLQKYSQLIEATAEFMYDYAHWDAYRKCYVLGPPLVTAREGNSQTYLNNINPTFELAYWSWGLKQANEWRARRGQKRNPDWDRMAEQMAPWPIVDGVYVEAEAVTEADGGHPTQLAAYGFLPESTPLDKDVMRRTLKHVMQHWEWASTWGWDYPLIAMTAIRLNEPELALQALLKEVQKNTYLPNGHNYQDEGLPIYLPGNGGLLTVVAMMCAGWEGCETANPGFPKDGNWQVRWEGLKPMF